MANEEQYPKDFQEFLDQFKTEDDCWNYVFPMRWPNGFTFPRCKGKQIDRVRFGCISEATSNFLLSFIEENVEPGSTIITDGWGGYRPFSQSKIYKHKIKNISGSGQKAHELLPHVHMVDSLVKRWINGTHQGQKRVKQKLCLKGSLRNRRGPFNCGNR
jgi:hypothetical protein